MKLACHIFPKTIFRRESGRVFASDMQGNLLDKASWHGEATVILENSTVHHDSISFTISRYGRNTSMKTEWGVPSGSTRPHDGRSYITYPHSDLHFLNAPECDRYIVSSPGFSSYQSENLPASKSVGIHGGSIDVFVGIHPTNSLPQGGWVRGVQADNPDSLDFLKPDTVSPLMLTRFFCWKEAAFSPAGLAITVPIRRKII